jgi:hypothetical protein
VRRQPSQLGIVQPMSLAGRAVLVHQPGAKDQRIVCPEGNLAAGIHDGAQRHRLNGGVDPQRHVGPGAQLKRDASLGQVLQQCRILCRPDPMAHAVRL